MLNKSYVMKYLIDYENSHNGQYASLTDPAFYGRHNQFKLIELCKTLVTEEGLAEWESGKSTTLNIRVTEEGKRYFRDRRQLRGSFWRGVASGIMVTIVAELLLFWLIGRV